MEPSPSKDARDPQAAPSSTGPDAVPAPREPAGPDRVGEGQGQPGVAAGPDGTTTSPEADASAAEQSEPPPSIWNLRTVFVVALAGAVVLCFGGLIFGYVQYDKIAEPDRGTPSLAVDQYLSARLTDRDEARARLFTCKSPTLGPVDELLGDVVDREQQFGIRIEVRSSDFVISSVDQSASVDANLKIDVPEEGGQSSRSIQRWRFDVVQEDGWRVCAASRLA